MASGKSAVGEAFALSRGQKFVDTDRMIVALHGPIKGIFTSRGEAWFRGMEARMTAECLESDAYQVVSLGGGAILDSGTQQLLASTVVVFLSVDAKTVGPRLKRGSARPLLNGDTMDRWEELFQQRLPVYQRLADIVLDARRKSVSALVEELGLILTESGG
ncbi:shikimate kinase [Arthrobacter roseus]|uniref:shikimate kinase n=1 Tax=Arthrobacter roseus TaxID=136274 RepID=UPI001EF7D1EC|nr:shikimate kinase [Arthrobacter roseus]MBM7848644.1 shikimate kinase [Arthrobacter roseus]